MLRNIFIFFTFTCLAFAEPFFTPYTTKLSSVEGGYAKVADSDNLVLGSSGIVLRQLDETKSTIIARVVVVEKKDGVATLEFEVYEGLEQSALPIPNVMPKAGDKTILNYLYSRALIVAPNVEIYREITNHFTDITWVNPDLMGAYLANEYNPAPKLKDFQKMCNINTTGLIFVALENNGYFADCTSFKILKSYKSGKVAYYEIPFYTRIKDIEFAFWRFGESKITDYESYYRSMLVK